MNVALSGPKNVLRSIHDAINDLAEHPLASPRTSVSDIRVKILGRYRYKIFYSMTDDGFVEIIHVRHAARRPWRPD